MKKTEKKEDDIPKGYQDLCNRLYKKDVTSGDGILETKELCRIVDASLEKLSDSQKKVVCLSYGLYESPQSPQTIGEICCDEITYIKETHAKAIRKLKKVFHHKLLMFEQQKKQVVVEVVEVCPDFIKENPILLEVITPKNVGVGIYNCLQKAEIKFVYQLVNKTPEFISKIQDFGKKKMSELQRFLSDHGLSLGMKFSPEQIVYFELQILKNKNNEKNKQRITRGAN